MHDAGPFSRLYPDRAVQGLHRFTAGSQEIFPAEADPHAVGRRLPQDVFRGPVDPVRMAEYGEFPARPSFLHGPGLGIRIQRPQINEPFLRVRERFRRHVVDIAHQFRDAAIGALFCLSQKDADTVCPVKFFRSDPDADGRSPHHRHIPEMLREMYEQGRPGGRTQFSPDLSAVHGDIRQKIGRGRRRDRHHAVGAADRAAPHMDRRRQDPVRTEHLQGITDSGHIRHRIQGAHFVEMHVARRTPVGLRLCFRDQVIDPSRMFPHALRQREPVDQRRDMSRGSMMMPVLMCMSMLMSASVVMQEVLRMPVRLVRLPLFLSVHGHFHMCARDPAGRLPAGRHFYPRKTQPVHLFHKLPFLFIAQQFVQRRHQHVAGRAHITFNI